MEKIEKEINALSEETNHFNIEQNNKKLIENMIAKSQDSFFLAIELYNKPTINLRVDSFCFFICNAWELLFKAFLLKNNQTIYYTNPNNVNRTLSLTNCLEKVITNSNDPVRINLETIIGIGNMATHLIIPEYATLMNEVFLACVKNYTLNLQQHFNINISDRLSSGFMSVVLPTDSSSTAVLGKYSQEIIDKYKETAGKLNTIILNLNNDKKIVNSSFALSYQLAFKRVGSKEDADLLVARVAPKDAEMAIMPVVYDPNDLYPFSRKQLIKEVNKELTAKNIKFQPASSKSETIFNADNCNLIMNAFKIKEKSEYAFKHKVGNQEHYTYSLSLVQFIINKFQDDPGILPKIKKNIKNKS